MATGHYHYGLGTDLFARGVHTMLAPTYARGAAAVCASFVSDFVDLPAGRMVNNAMPTPPQPPSRPIASASPTVTSARQPVSAAPVAAEVKLPAGPATTPPRSKGGLDQRSGLDQRILRAAGSFDVLLRNGQTWSHVRLLDMDTWSLLIETEQGRVLLPKHAVDAYLLGRPGTV